MLCASLIAMIAALSAGANPPASFSVSHRPPPIAEVQQRAIEYARLDPSEISTWKRRARLAPLLPKLQVSYDRKLQYYVNVDVNDSVYVGSSGTTVGPRQGSYKSNQNNNNDVGIKAVWSLNETIFNADMLAVSEEARALARDRQAILAEVNKNYYERDRVAGEIAFLSKSLVSSPDDDKIKQEIFMKRVALDEATAALDALTGGWFGKEIEDRDSPSGVRAAQTEKSVTRASSFVRRTSK